MTDLLVIGGSGFVGGRMERDDWANRAIALYDLYEPSLQFIRRSESITYRVTEGGSTSLLRGEPFLFTMEEKVE